MTSYPSTYIQSQGHSENCNTSVNNVSSVGGKGKMLVAEKIHLGSFGNIIFIFLTLTSCNSGMANLLRCRQKYTSAILSKYKAI